MQKLIIEHGKKVYIDLSQEEIDEVTTRTNEAQAKEAERQQKKLAKQEALARLRKDDLFKDLLLVLGLDENG